MTHPAIEEEARELEEARQLLFALAVQYPDWAAQHPGALEEAWAAIRDELPAIFQALKECARAAEVLVSYETSSGPKKREVARYLGSRLKAGDTHAVISILENLQLIATPRNRRVKPDPLGWERKARFQLWLKGKGDPSDVDVADVMAELKGTDQEDERTSILRRRRKKKRV